LSIPLTQLANSQEFGTWFIRQNQMSGILSSNTVTADSTTGGSLTTGNVQVNGDVAILKLSIGNTIAGGNLTTTGNLTFTTNTIFANGINQYLKLTSNASVTEMSLSPNVIVIANSTIIEGNINFSNGVTIGNSTVNSFITPTNFNLGGLPANSYANNSTPIISTTLTIGNSTVNTIINSTTTFGSTPPGTNTMIAFNNSNTVGGDANLVWLSPNATLQVSNAVLLGNSTVNGMINSIYYSGQSNSTNNSTWILLATDTVTVNTSIITFTSIPQNCSDLMLEGLNIRGSNLTSINPYLANVFISNNNGSSYPIAVAGLAGTSNGFLSFLMCMLGYTSSMPKMIIGPLNVNSVNTNIAAPFISNVALGSVGIQYVLGMQNTNSVQIFVSPLETINAISTGTFNLYGRL
jgi:hypothetical protein